MLGKNYQDLLKDNQVKRWYDNLSRGSIITAGVYLRRLGAFCSRNKVTPRLLLRKGPKQIKNMILDMVTDLSNQKNAGSYIYSNVKAVKSWLKFNEVEIKGSIEIKGVKDTPTLREERVPTKEELHKILMSADNKQKVACLLIAHAGLRPETLGDFVGQDGLKVSDFPEMKIQKDGVSFGKLPTIVRVRSNLSKAGHQYFTFLSEEGCQYLRDYLVERMRRGEELQKDSAIITARKNRHRPHVSSSKVGEMIRYSIRAAGFEWRPYVLRSYFETQLMLGESKGFIIRDYRTFFMGHVGDIENRYSTNKSRLPSEVIENMRESYRKASEFLDTTKKEASPEQVDKVRKELEADIDKRINLKSLENALALLPRKGPPAEKLYEDYRRDHGISRELAYEEKVMILERERDRIAEENRAEEEAILESIGSDEQRRQGIDKLKSRDREKRHFLS